jgi:uncharacterized OB-fold protein
MAQQRPDRTLGPGHNTFWDWCCKGELRLQCCTTCHEISWPVVQQSCEYCGSTQLVWKRMSGKGKVVSWCVFERDYYQGQLPIPWATILVELAEGPLFISNPEGFIWEDIETDMQVQLRFIDCEDTAGAFRLPVFARA